jgi:hypothetical protein
VFGYKNELREYSNEATGEDRELSVIGLANLKRFFREDYEALTKLYCWGKIKREVFVDAYDIAEELRQVLPGTKGQSEQGWEQGFDALASVLEKHG